MKTINTEKFRFVKRHFDRQEDGWYWPGLDNDSHVSVTMRHDVAVVRTDKIELGFYMEFKATDLWIGVIN